MDALYPVIGGRRLICHSEVDTLHEPYALILDTNVIKDIGSFFLVIDKLVQNYGNS